MTNWCVAALTLMLAFTLAGCADRTSQVSSSQSSAVASGTEVPESSVPPPDADSIDVTLHSVIEACAAVFDVSKLPEQGYFDPTSEEYALMQAQVAKLGVPVDARDCDMQNYEQIVSFYNDAKSGKDASVAIYSIRNFGVLANTFVSEKGKISYALSAEDFAVPDSFSVDPAADVASFELTEGGHLLYSLAPDGNNESATGGFCVLAHSAEFRALRREYIDRVAYGAGGVLTVNWDANDMSQLNWEFLFEQLNFYKTGKFLSDAFSTPYPGDENRLAIPAAEVDAVLQSFFPVSDSTLHALNQYDAERNVYAWHGFNGGGYSPTPEVIASKQNTDGTLTLTVGALELEWGEEYTFTSELTVLPKADGSFQYISNKMDSTTQA